MAVAIMKRDLFLPILESILGHKESLEKIRHGTAPLD